MITISITFCLWNKILWWHRNIYFHTMFILGKILKFIKPTHSIKFTYQTFNTSFWKVYINKWSITCVLNKQWNIEYSNKISSYNLSHFDCINKIQKNNCGQTNAAINGVWSFYINKLKIKKKLRHNSRVVTRVL